VQFVEERLFPLVPPLNRRAATAVRNLSLFAWSQQALPDTALVQERTPPRRTDSQQVS
jgi:hypothetical protein